MHESLIEILEYTPEIRYFAIGSHDLALRNAFDDTYGKSRRKASRVKYHRWKRRVDEILNTPSQVDPVALASRVESLPFNAFFLESNLPDAELRINSIAEQLSAIASVGMTEKIISDELAVIWLRVDK